MMEIGGVSQLALGKQRSCAISWIKGSEVLLNISPVLATRLRDFQCEDLAGPKPDAFREDALYRAFVESGED